MKIEKNNEEREAAKTENSRRHFLGVGNERKMHSKDEIDGAVEENRRVRREREGGGRRNENDEGRRRRAKEMKE